MLPEADVGSFIVGMLQFKVMRAAIPDDFRLNALFVVPSDIFVIVVYRSIVLELKETLINIDFFNFPDLTCDLARLKQIEMKIVAKDILN